MKILQLIDSLDPGGAEKMAVTLANSLVNEIETSHLATTRKEGLLTEILNDSVGYLFVRKSGTLDLAALLRLRRYILKNEIDVIHAHSSSVFWGTLINLTIPSVRLVWHNHLGASEHIENRKLRILRFCSMYIHAIISVNTGLCKWAEENLLCKRVEYLKNFVSPDTLTPNIELSGDPEYRIVCLANLRPDKDHINLLMAFKQVRESFPKATLHCIGKKIDTEYCSNIEAYIVDNRLSNVFIHGEQKGIHHLLKQAAIGVLSSKSEGLPLALLEYGMARLPVVCTDVGQCKEVIGEFGSIIPSGNPEALAIGLKKYLEDRDKAQNDAMQLSKHIMANYSFKVILPQLMNIYDG